MKTSPYTLSLEQRSELHSAAIAKFSDGSTYNDQCFYCEEIYHQCRALNIEHHNAIIESLHQTAETYEQFRQQQKTPTQAG